MKDENFLFNPKFLDGLINYKDLHENLCTLYDPKSLYNFVETINNKDEESLNPIKKIRKSENSTTDKIIINKKLFL